MAACVSSCSVCTKCCAACVPRCTALSAHTTTWNTCCHNTAQLITRYFYWLLLQKCNFSKAQYKLPEDGPGGPKHNDTPQSVGLVWTSDHLIVETSTWQHTTLTTDKHPCPGWDSNPQSQQSTGRRPTPYTARALGPAIIYYCIIFLWDHRRICGPSLTETSLCGAWLQDFTWPSLQSNSVNTEFFVSL